MSANDTFPVDADYAVTRTKESNVLRGRVESAREYFRQKAAPRRIFDLVFTRRSVADWASIENFRLKMMTEYFLFNDKTAGRYFACYFNTEPLYEEAGNQQVNIKLQLIEAIGCDLGSLNYPNFAAGNPFATVNVNQATDLGANGKQFLYAGYGYRVNGTYASIFLDEVDSTGTGGTNLGVPLGLHRVRVVGGEPASLDYLI